MTSNTAEKKNRKEPIGPHGLGDPEDTHLRKMEKNVLIPSLKAKYIREEKCVDIIRIYEECVLKAGLILAPFKCKELKIELNDCVAYWHDSEELLARAKQEYLQDRSEYRRTGVCQQNREYITRVINEKKARGEDVYAKYRLFSKGT